jgi:hypothetical protein
MLYKMEKNMFQSMSSMQSYKNGKLVTSKELDVKYDGKKLNVTKVDNGKKECYSIKKNSIEKILSQPQSPESLEKRLKKLKTKCKTHKKKPNKKTRKKRKSKSKKKSKSKSRK